MQESAIELINVNKSINNKEIIRNLTFSINRGEVFGFIGPNGAGKTTTIRMIVGLVQLTDGDIRILGDSIKSHFKEAIKNVGAIVENPDMYPFLSGKQNLLQYARMTAGVTRERIQEIIKLVGLESAITDKIKTYSLGMRQRLGIAQSLLHNPAVLILDEPTNGLDPAGIREIRHYIRRLAKEENVAVIISSHLLSEIEQICDRIGLIKNGELIALESINTESDQDEVNHIHLEASPIDKTYRLLQRNYELNISQENESLYFQLRKKEIPELIQILVINKILIYQITTYKVTIEDKFFDWIGENVNE